VDVRSSPRSIEYEVLRACERLRLSDAEFDALPYARQLRLLAYSRLRGEEELAG
jgi:hypothetical protein